MSATEIQVRFAENVPTDVVQSFGGIGFVNLLLSKQELF